MQGRRTARPAQRQTQTPIITQRFSHTRAIRRVTAALCRRALDPASNAASTHRCLLGRWSCLAWTHHPIVAHGLTYLCTLPGKSLRAVLRCALLLSGDSPPRGNRAGLARRLGCFAGTSARSHVSGRGASRPRDVAAWRVGTRRLPVFQGAGPRPAPCGVLPAFGRSPSVNVQIVRCLLAFDRHSQCSFANKAGRRQRVSIPVFARIRRYSQLFQPPKLTEAGPQLSPSLLLLSPEFSMFSK